MQYNIHDSLRNPTNLLQSILLANDYYLEAYIVLDSIGRTVVYGQQSSAQIFGFTRPFVVNVFGRLYLHNLWTERVT